MGAGNQLAVRYDVQGTEVSFDIDFVKRYLVRGDANKLSDQEAIFFMNLCKAQKLNPLNGSDCYCVKYGSSPAQLIVGKSAYMKRAFNNPNYLYKEDGVVVLSNNTVVKKEGCCVYPNERLLGGWCRVHYMKSNVHCTAYKEVSFDEYNKGQSTWKAMPATMISKVAISQCVRDAFPDEYAGLYSEEEMVACGQLKQDDVYQQNQESEQVVYTLTDNDTKPVKEAVNITNDERKGMIALALEVYVDKAVAQEKLKALIKDEGCTDTYSLTREAYERIVDALNKAKQPEEKAEDGLFIDGIQMAIEDYKESDNGLPFA